MSTSRSPEQDDEQQAAQPRQRLSQRTFHSILEQRIAAAEAEGLFENLPGAGRPLQLDDDSMVPEEDRVGYRLLKGSGFAPPWIELQKQILADQAKLEAWLKRANQHWAHTPPARQARLRSEYHEQLVALNRLILHYNLSIPRGVGQLPTPRLQDELKRLGVAPGE